MNRLAEIRQQKVGSQRRLYHLMTLRAELPEWSTFKTRVSKWENGRAVPNDFYMSLLCAVLGVSEAELGFSEPQSEESTLLLHSLLPPSVASPEMATFLASEFDRYAQVDREHGPQLVINLVRAQCQTIENLIRTAKEPVRTELLHLGAKFFEFGGWLAQDSGYPDVAEKFTSRALDMAYEAGDTPLVSYIFMRRSNIASEAEKSAEALGLARSALRSKPQLGPKTLALALRAEARALALEGDESGAVRAIERAVELASENGIPEPQAEYCTPSYVQMERSITLLRLGRPGDAIEPLTAAINGWSEGDQRDKGIALARLATTHALTGDLDVDFMRGQEALTVIKSAPSSRAIEEMVTLQKRLSVWKNDKRVMALGDLIRNVRRN